MTARVTLARISAEPLVVSDCVAAVSSDPGVGGVGVFVGTVRDNDHDRSVASLSYEAHPSAAAALEEACAAIGAGDLIAVAAEHRTGDLVIGDVAVVVAVSAAHRGDALEATRALIDRIKATVPIWKHQVFTDGSAEWVNCA